MYILAMSKAGVTIGMLLWIIVLFGFMYFFMARPQKQEQKRKEAMRADLAINGKQTSFRRKAVLLFTFYSIQL